MPPRRVVAAILERLRLAVPAEQAGVTWRPSADFVEFLKDQLGALGHVTARRMFSGAGVYCDGVIFALVLRDTLYFKVDDGNRAAYEAEGLKPFTYEAKGRTMQSGPTGACPSACSTIPTRWSSGRGPRWRPGSGAAARRRSRRQAPLPARRGEARRRCSGASPSPHAEEWGEGISTGHTGAWVPSGTGGRAQKAGVSDRRGGVADEGEAAEGRVHLVQQVGDVGGRGIGAGEAVLEAAEALQASARSAPARRARATSRPRAPCAPAPSSRRTPSGSRWRGRAPGRAAPWAAAGRRRPRPRRG